MSHLFYYQYGGIYFFLLLFERMYLIVFICTLHNTYIYYKNKKKTIQTTPVDCHGNGCNHRLASAKSKPCPPFDRCFPVSTDEYEFEGESSLLLVLSTRTELETRLITTKRSRDDFLTWRKFMKFILHVYRFELLPFVHIILVDFFERSPMVCLFDRK